MSIPDIKPGGWGVNEELTSAQITDVRTYLTHALDKTAANDTVVGAITWGSGSSLITDAGATVTFAEVSALTVKAAGTLTAAATSVVVLAGSVALSGATTVTNTFSLSGAAAALNYRAPLTLTSGPASQTVYFYNDVCTTPVLQSADIKAEIDTVGAPDGARVRLVRTTPMIARKAELANGIAGSVIGTIPTGEIGWLEAQKVSGAWTIIGWGGTVTIP